jgi:anti-sigma regulatory factor (Ser/Thr protein kinase)
VTRLRLTLLATPEHVPIARTAIDQLCEQAGITGEVAETIRLAVTEACTNCVLHAYDAGVPSPTFVLDARAEVNALLVVVHDSGLGITRGRSSKAGGLGLGLPLIKQLADSTLVSSRPGRGTSVAMRFATHHKIGPSTSVRPAEPGLTS